MARIFALQKTRGQFQFADNRQAQGAHLHQFRRSQGHARADYDQVLAAKGQQSVAAGFHRDTLFEQGGNFFAQRLVRCAWSETVTWAPRRRRKRAAAKPDLPSPTTRTFLPLSSMHQSNLFP